MFVRLVDRWFVCLFVDMFVRRVLFLCVATRLLDNVSMCAFACVLLCLFSGVLCVLCVCVFVLCVCLCVCSFARLLDWLFVCVLLFACVCSFERSLVCSLVCVLMCLFVCLFLCV